MGRNHGLHVPYGESNIVASAFIEMPNHFSYLDLVEMTKGLAGDMQNQLIKLDKQMKCLSRSVRENTVRS